MGTRSPGKGRVGSAQWFAIPHVLHRLLFTLLLANLFSEDAATVPEANKITLTFVFDSTGSMSDELSQVKKAMQEIFDYMKENRADEIANFALVEFNDPNARLMTVTTNSEEYRKKLGDIEVDGGNDCPEMAMEGLKIALENSLPHSFIFAFTDASAKDYFKQAEIENIIQRKKSKIVFVLTGQCGSDTDPAYQVYYSVAKVSNGHVFNLLKNEVKQVLQFVKLETGRKTILNSGEIPKGSTATLKTPVDESMKELTVTVTGNNPTINMIDPTGKNNDGKTILKLGSVESKQVKDPKPGNWTIEVGTHSPGRFVITTDSSFNFVYGFSLKPTEEMAETGPRPLKGTENALLIKITNNTNSIQLIEVTIKDTKNQILKKIRLHPVPGKDGTYKADKFLPPNSIFLLEVFGQDSYNNSVIRLSDSGISPQPPALPIITLEKEETAILKSPFTLECHVESLVPFTASWFMGSKNIVPEQAFQQSSKIKYYIDNTTMSTGGIYTCKARNAEGPVSENVKLNVQVPPPLVKTSKTVELLVGQPGEITCSVDSDLDYEIKWEKRSSSGTYLPINDIKFAIKGDNLFIASIERSDEGSYKCIAQSIFGVGESEVQLEVEQLTKVNVSGDKKFKENEKVELLCTATGSLPLSIIWKKNDISVPVRSLTYKVLCHILINIVFIS